MSPDILGASVGAWAGIWKGILALAVVCLVLWYLWKFKIGRVVIIAFIALAIFILVNGSAP